MTDDVAKLESEEESPDSGQEDGSNTATSLFVRIALGTAGLCLVIGFFLPWINLNTQSSVSGLGLVASDDHVIRAAFDGAQRWLLLLIPILGILLTAIGFLGFRWSTKVAALVGLTIIGFGFVTLILIFIERTGYGLWLVFTGAFLSLVLGIFPWLRARDQKKKAKGSAAEGSAAEGSAADVT